MTKDEAYAEISKNLIEIFEISEAEIKPEAKLMDDLGLDSIDAVDMMVQLQETTGQKVSPEQFENVVTVDDLVGLVIELTEK
ncbi:acyl carrier protein [Hirschia baltica]|uniref:Phosphopantetheine-binding n=1 Tax=Hirschia baltica (strain ATCC 49814 / DSM 5838 / IFAM 1418) TaxID=582402 RepID=C6XIQ8_HIRBI|nr:acyl carrier protein [Hirschia baltica]ACT59003.1 phosphopantetheine-binding [Hirschia baltica ATCC 49814]